VKKVIAILIPACFLAFFILIMTSSYFLTRPFGTKDDVPAIVDEIKTEAVSGDWQGAKDGAESLEEAWEIVSTRVQFSAARDEIRDGKSSIARLKGYIEANDEAGALSELGELKEHWKNMGE
jgi:hypothetical protein